MTLPVGNVTPLPPDLPREKMARKMACALDALSMACEGRHWEFDMRFAMRLGNALAMRLGMRLACALECAWHAPWNALGMRLGMRLACALCL